MSRDELRKPLDPLGSPARVRVTKVVRTQYRVEWEYDGYYWSFDHETGTDDITPVRRRRARFTNTKTVAYRMAAWRLVFARRDRYAIRGQNGKAEKCKLCESVPVRYAGEDGPQACKYHDEATLEPMIARLARRLRWLDGRSPTCGRRGAAA